MVRCGAVRPFATVLFAFVLVLVLVFVAVEGHNFAEERGAEHIARGGRHCRAAQQLPLLLLLVVALAAAAARAQGRAGLEQRADDAHRVAADGAAQRGRNAVPNLWVRLRERQKERRRRRRRGGMRTVK